ncbi:MAG: hypothetical protein VX589_10855 [Myxococcota bacterium]|nr:hypothetical protein [Myxococcota bacterium]
MRRGHRYLLGAVCCLVSLVGCTKKKDVAPKKKATAEAKIAQSAEEAEAKQSWILSTAQDPQPLTALAQSSEGWRGLFQNKLVEALAAFRAVKKPSKLDRIGWARTSLEVMRAYRILAELENAVEIAHSKAEDSRPNAEGTEPWRKYVRGRRAQAAGKDQEAMRQLAEIGVQNKDAHLLAQAAMPGAEGGLAQLLGGQGDGQAGDIPSWLSRHYLQRLRLKAKLSNTGLTQGVLRRFERLEPDVPDIVFGQGQTESIYWDPALRRLPVRLYAMEALRALEGTSGWTDLLRAHALYALGRFEEALEALNRLTDLALDEVPYSLIVISPMAGPADVKYEATALKGFVLTSMGRQKDAKVLIQNLPRVTMSQRVRIAWVRSRLGEALPDAFPEDRAKLSAVYRAQLSALKANGRGVSTVSELGLVDRYVDQVQRRWADALYESGKRARAARARTAAEDKTAAMRVSSRNSVAALLAAARDYFRIGQERVTNKYVGRVEEDFPAVKRVASRLRDLLSFKAMEHGDSASAGQ